MSDTDIINRMSNVEKKQDNIISLEQIASEIPMLDFESPMLYELYLHYNNESLSGAEKQKLQKIVETLKYNLSIDMKKNLDYLTKDIK